MKEKWRNIYLVCLLPFSRALGPQEASSSKIIQQWGVCRAQNSNSGSLAQKQTTACKPSSITEKRTIICARASPRPRCGSACFYSQINQTHLLSGGLSLSVRVLRWFQWRRMEIDHLLSALRLYERRTPADPPPTANPLASLRWQTAKAAYRRPEAPGKAHSHSPPPLGPGPETGRAEESF